MHKGIMLGLAALLSGCINQEAQLCHDKVQAQAKFTAEIVSTDRNRTGDNHYQVTGRAKIQNGLGAWTNYRYQCDFNQGDLVGFNLTAGWGG